MLAGPTLPGVVACTLTGTVLLASARLKSLDAPAYDAWIESSFRSPSIRRLLRHWLLPVELGVSLALLLAAWHQQGIWAAAGTSTLLLCLAFLAERISGGKPCACFGTLTLSGRLRPVLLFLLLLFTTLALLSIELFGPRLPAPDGAVIAALALSLLAVASLPRVAGYVSRLAPAPQPSSRRLPDEFVSALEAAHAGGYAGGPVFVFFSAKGCGACKEFIGPFLRFANSFPDSATYFLFEYGSVNCEEALGSAVTSIPGPSLAVPKSIGLTQFPSAVFIKGGIESGEWQTYIGEADLRLALAALIA